MVNRCEVFLRLLCVPGSAHCILIPSNFIFIEKFQIDISNILLYSFLYKFFIATDLLSAAFITLKICTALWEYYFIFLVRKRLTNNSCCSLISELARAFVPPVKLYFIPRIVHGLKLNGRWRNGGNLIKVNARRKLPRLP